MQTGSGDSFTDEAVRIIKKIPRGKVATYGQIAAMAGSPRGARQVVRLLNTKSRTERLPWHRIINRLGRIALPPGGGFELQRELLRREKVIVGAEGQIDLKKYLWRPRV